MENNIFRDAGTQLDLNGPILSLVQEPTVESLTFDVALNDLPDGTNTFTLSGAKGSDNFTNFEANKAYELIPRGTFTSTITLKGAAGGSDGALDYGGSGGGVKGTVKFEKGVGILLENIHLWRKAPIWNKKSINIATKSWFKYLS